MADIRFDPLLSDAQVVALTPALHDALAAPHRRIQPLDTATGRFWLKRVERHKSLARRLQKGDAKAAFRLELLAHRRLARIGAPVAPAVAWGPDWLVTPEVGATVLALLRDPDVSDATRLVAITDAARMLANLHRMRLRHGRPKLRDICWAKQADGTHTAIMIDLERFKENASVAELGADAAVFAHSILEGQATRTPLFDAAMTAYRSDAPPGMLGSLALCDPQVSVVDAPCPDRRPALSAPARVARGT